MSNLKQKMAEKLDQEKEEVIEVNVVEEGEDNIVPFNKKQEELPVVQVVPDFAITINEARDRIAALQRFVKEFMIPGQDFGIIPGCNKPSLLKPGAEKLTDIFGFSKLVTVLNRVEDWQQGFFSYEVKVTLTSKRTGLVEAEGIGSCNSKEKKYRSQDPFTIINTILKMSKKRALVDSVLSATRTSGIFTQDIEDWESEPFQPKNLNVQTSSTVPVDKKHEPYNNSEPLADRKQLVVLYSIVAQKGIPVERVKAMMKNKYGVIESKQLTAKQANNFIDFIKAFQQSDETQNKKLPTNA